MAVFRVTDGLFTLYGSERVLDTPIAEASIVGVSIGLAAQGFRPVAEIQFAGLAYACIDQLLNHSARLRTRTRGTSELPNGAALAGGRRDSGGRASFGES
jgi:2-oxoisovalerate dehydrogenase E1 component beta subunit